jgi:D-apionolactonase
MWTVLGILVFQNAVMHKNIIWHGGHDPDCRRRLKAGRLSMIYENGSIRHINTGNHEIIRMIYLAVRDREWLTIRPAISDEQVIVRTDSFLIKFRYHFLSGDISFSARMIIEGSSDSTLSLRFRGEAHSSFEKNRSGFCVLHPITDMAGNDCMTENPDGELTIGKFPLHISPHQPFTDITLMQWNIRGISCRLDFYGDVFETEDQRNWTDASYKTYAPPLKVPYPVRVEKGETQYQKIILKIQSDNSEIPAVPKSKSIKVFPDIKVPIPGIGIGRTTRPMPLTDHEASVIRDAGFTHYRADIYLFRENWETEASLAAGEALQLNCPPELALFFDDDFSAQADRFTAWASSKKCPIAVVLLFHKDHNHTPETLLKQLLPILRNALPGTQIGTGTNANFAQVNRNRPGSADPDLICWSVHPQEHANDNLTLTENIGGQAYTVVTARSFSSAKAWVSPVNLARRFNPNVENFESPAEKESGFPPQADSRIMSLFGACWTAGSLKQLSESGAAGITYYETAGERGIIQGDFPSRWPEEFPAEKGMIFPLYHVFRFILNSKSYNVLKCTSDDPLSTDALVLSDGENARFILVNFSESDQVTAIEGLQGKFTLRQLNEDTFPDAASDPLWLNKAPQKKIIGKRLRLPKYSVSFGEGKIERRASSVER